MFVNSKKKNEVKMKPLQRSISKIIPPSSSHALLSRRSGDGCGDGGCGDGGGGDGCGTPSGGGSVAGGWVRASLRRGVLLGCVTPSCGSDGRVSHG